MKQQFVVRGRLLDSLRFREIDMESRHSTIGEAESRAEAWITSMVELRGAKPECEIEMVVLEHMATCPGCLAMLHKCDIGYFVGWDEVYCYRCAVEAKMSHGFWDLLGGVIDIPDEESVAKSASKKKRRCRKKRGSSNGRVAG